MPLIIAETSEQARTFARRLLDATDNPAEIATTSYVDGAIGFEVSDELADRAGFGNPAPSADAAAEAPARNASRAAWVVWLDSQDPPLEHPADAGRDDLVALWDAHTK